MPIDVEDKFAAQARDRCCALVHKVLMTRDDQSHWRALDKQGSPIRSTRHIQVASFTGPIAMRATSAFAFRSVPQTILAAPGSHRELRLNPVR